MKIIFIGSSAFAVPTLKMLATQQKHRLIGVITQPDGKKGRGLKEIAVSPVKEEALRHKVEIFQPESINEPSFIGLLRDRKPDLIIVAAYGQKLGQEILGLPGYGCLNIHPSLLPKYRGAAPVNYAVLNGDARTGISLIRMAAKMDAGPIITQIMVDIKDDETAVELEGRLAVESVRLVQPVLDNIEAGGISETVQNDKAATFAPKLKKADGEIDWARPAREIINQIRALQPWPGAYTYYKPDGQAALKIDVLKAEPNKYKDPVTGSRPGRVAEITNNELIISCGQEESLSIITVKPSGGRVLTAREFINGYRLKTGAKFGKETE